MRPLFIGYDARGKPVRLKPDDRKIHMHVLGSSGSGRATMSFSGRPRKRR